MTNVTHRDEGPITVFNTSDTEVMIAGIVVPPRGRNDNFPRGLLPSVQAHPSLTTDGEAPQQPTQTKQPQASSIIPIKYGLEPEQGISVVIPSLDRTTLLERACRSVLASSFTEYEIIVVDDGSSVDIFDTISIVAKQCKENRVGFMHVYSSFNHGIATTRNMGAKLAKYDAILMMDSDDEITPNALMLFSETFTRTGADVIYCNIRTVNDNNGTEWTGDAPEWKSGKLKNTGCYILGSRLISRKAWLSVSGCDENFTMAEDLDILIRIEDAGGLFVKINETLCTVHDHEDRVTKSVDSRKELGVTAMQARGKTPKKK